MVRRRLIAAVLAATAFSVPLLYELLRTPSPDRSETPMLYRNLALSLEEISVPFTRIAPWGADERVHEMSLSTPLPEDVLRHSEIGLQFTLNNHTSPHPAFGRLQFAGTECVYETGPETYIAGGRITMFHRNEECSFAATHPTGEITLTVRMGGPGDLGLATRVLPPETMADRIVRANGLIYVAEPDASVRSAPPAVMGVFVDTFGTRGLRRGNLLSYMWTKRVDQWPLLATLAVCASLLAGGVLLFPTAPAHGSLRMALRAGAGAFCLAGAVSLAYAMLVPPLHAADETAFARSYGELTRQPDLLPQFQQIARDNHFERIKGSATERFRPRDVGTPLDYVQKFESLIMPTRSSTTTWLWTAVDGATRGMDARRLFALVRLIDMLIFAVTVGVATTMLVALTHVRYAQLLSFPFFIIPTVPFFGMQFSETALLTSAAVLLAGSIVVIALDGPRSHWAGFPFGLAAAGLWLSTRSSLPMVGMVAAVAMGRILLGRHSQKPIVATAIFWGGAGLAALAFFSIATVDHLTRILEMAATGNARLADNGLSIPGWILLNPWIVVVATATVCAAAELMFMRARQALASRQWVMERATPVLAYGLVAAIAVSLIGSWWFDYPDVQNIESPFGPDTWTYTKQILVGTLTMFRLRGSSTYLSDSVWAGFGWLDTIPSDTYVAIPITLTAVALALLLVRIGRTRNARAAAWLLILGSGGLATLVAYAFAAKQVNTNLHGRFLLPWYLVMVTLAWIWPALGRQDDSGRATPRFILLLGIGIALHAYALCFNMNRYF